MNTPTLGALILVSLALLTYIWVAARAFRQHIGWGIGVLFLFPVAILVYGLRFWDTEKKPVLLSLVMTVSAFGLCLYLFGSWGGWEMLRANAAVQQGIESQRLNRETAENFLRVNQQFTANSGLKLANADTAVYLREFIRQEAEQQAVLRAQEDRQSQADNLGDQTINKQVSSAPREHTRLRYRTVRPEDAYRYIGATVKVTRRNVEEKEYRLIGASGKSLQFAQRNSSGAYSFAFRIADIQKLRVLVREPQTASN